MSVIVKGMDMPKRCFKYEIYCRILCESVDGLPETILKDRFFIPGNIENYRIPHEIASYVELKLRENMLTEEESKQAKQEEKNKEKLTAMNYEALKFASNCLKGCFLVDMHGQRAVHIDHISYIDVGVRDTKDNERQIFIYAKEKTGDKFIVLGNAKTFENAECYIKALLDKINARETHACDK